MGFAFGDTLYRHRYPLTKPDPYNPSNLVPDRSATPETIPLPGGFLDSPSTSRLLDAVRTQTVTDYVLFLSDIALDVVDGDFVGTTENPTLAEYVVNGETSAPKNPFTGWQPYLEVPLKKAVG